jgi:chloramphenicol-sensitive protein RarD
VQKSHDEIAQPRSEASTARLGTLAAFGAYGFWGLFPLYWKRLAGVDPVQILCHRIFWAAVFTIAVLALRGRLGALTEVLRSRKRLAALLASALLVTTNWGVYIWAVNNGHLTESALGYYINPLLSVAIGALLLGERLDRWTRLAVGIATLGVTLASFMIGSPPWISLMLAASFALYGYVKKRLGLDPLAGLAAETFLLAPLALAYLVFEQLSGRGGFGGSDQVATFMLAFSGIVTAIPLLCFASAANKITLTRMGFIQFVSPSSQLSLSLFLYHEKLTAPMAVAFATVIAAVAIYAATRGSKQARAASNDDAEALAEN